MLARLIQSLLLQSGLKAPDDDNLIGFDNTPHSEFAAPPISTMEMGIEEFGREISRCLIDLIEGRKVSFIPPKPKWIPRSTCRFE